MVSLTPFDDDEDDEEDLDDVEHDDEDEGVWECAMLCSLFNSTGLMNSFAEVDTETGFVSFSCARLILFACRLRPDFSVLLLKKLAPDVDGIGSK